MNRMRQGQRVEVLLHRGMADVYYPGVAIADGRVLLEDGFPYGDSPGALLVEASEVADWRPVP